MKGMLKTQRRLASRLFGVGEKKVWLDPAKFKEIKEAITAEDVKGLIKKGFISEKKSAGQSRARARLFAMKKRRGHRTGVGSRKGKKNARMNFQWIDKVKALRNELFKERTAGKIDKKQFRVMYTKVKGNAFHSVNHMRNYIEEMKKS